MTYIDVDAVFRIGHFVSHPLQEPIIQEWIVSACALAKARLALVIVVNRATKREKIPLRSPWTAEIEKLAKEEYPPAMLLHATLLGRRGEYEESFQLFENKILPRLKPTRKVPLMFESIQMIEALDSPHRSYALVRAAHDAQFDAPESRQKADEAIRIAAIEYNEPEALIEYASVMMNENNLDMYEECMSKAAASGNPKAAFFIGNFYYLTYHGKYATRGERDSNQNRWPPPWLAWLTTPHEKGESPMPTKFAAGAAELDAETAKTDDPEAKHDDDRLRELKEELKTEPNSWYIKKQIARVEKRRAKRNNPDTEKSGSYLASFLNRSLPKEGYRSLAQDWYAVALHQGHRPAAFMRALLMRERSQSDEEREDAGVFFELARKTDDPDLTKQLLELERNWFDPTYEPTIRKKFLAVR